MKRKRMSAEAKEFHSASFSSTEQQKSEVKEKKKKKRDNKLQISSQNSSFSSPTPQVLLQKLNFCQNPPIPIQNFIYSTPTPLQNSTMSSPKPSTTIQEPSFEEKEVQVTGESSKKRDECGSLKNPIFVNPEPLKKAFSVEDEVQITGASSENKVKCGSNQNYPIPIEDIHDIDETDTLFLQIAIEESLVHVVEEIGDRKGKKPIIGGPLLKSETVVGEPSNPVPAKPDLYCNICMESKYDCDCFWVQNCSHYYCISCICQYVESKVEENETSIGCPDPTCKDGILEPQMCQWILKPEVFERWGRARCEAMFVSMSFYCPYKDCSALLIDDGENVIKDSECPHCNRMFCAQCKVPWHSGVSCEVFAKLGDDERGREDLMLREMAAKSKWQRCPVCKFYVEKIDGCMFMKCRCGHKFCYGCATTMTIDHYCRKCKR